MIAILTSTLDPAGMNIKQNLLDLKKWKEVGNFHKHPYYQYKDILLFTTDKESIHCEDIDKEIGEIELLIFATKHMSKAGVHSLSVHSTGNWDKAMFGGKDKTLTNTNANFLKNALNVLDQKSHEFEVIQEATHHGPYVTVPSVFIEIGSELEQWQDKAAGKIIAETIFEVLECKVQHEIAIGIGGMHHTPQFKKLNIAFGHVCPKHMLPFLTKELIDEAIEKCNATDIYLDWKGLGKEKQRIVELLKNKEYKKC
tara:strand:+ start:364 stop:1128 length:765 start_codon:yes stop_codon:yes gene_type:complete